MPFHVLLSCLAFYLPYLLLHDVVHDIALRVIPYRRIQVLPFTNPFAQLAGLDDLLLSHTLHSQHTLSHGHAYKRSSSPEGKLETCVTIFPSTRSPLPGIWLLVFILSTIIAFDLFAAFSLYVYYTCIIRVFLYRQQLNTLVSPFDMGYSN